MSHPSNRQAGSCGAPSVAVLGCGGWGKNLVRTMQGLGALRAVADPGEGGRQLARELAPDASIHADIDAILADDSIDGVCIATPAETHFDLATRAFNAGKDVFVEKPMTTNVDEAVELEQHRRRTGRLLMVGHLLEYHPAVIRLAQLVRSGELGNIRYLISNRLNLGKIRTEENALWSFAPHDIAVILRLVGAMPIEVVATGGSYVSPNIADVTVTQLLFSSGVRAHVFVSWLHPFKEQKLVVIGSKKMASFDDVQKELVLYDQRVDWQEGQPIPVRGEGVAVAFGDDEPLKAECQHFLDRIVDRETPRTDGLNGLRVLQILDAAQRSLMTNGQPVSITPAPLHASASVEIETMPTSAAVPGIAR